MKHFDLIFCFLDVDTDNPEVEDVEEETVEFLVKEETTIIE